MKFAFEIGFVIHMAIQKKRKANSSCRLKRRKDKREKERAVAFSLELGVRFSMFDWTIKS